MLAKDVMTKKVITVRPDTTVQDIANILLERRISGVPVVDASGRIVGIVSEGDLMRRPESTTEGHRSWWLAFLTLPDSDERRYVKTHGRHARDVMSAKVITVEEDAPVEQVATLMERSHIKRVPVVRGGALVGIVSRADLLRGVASSKVTSTPNVDDRALQNAVEAALRAHASYDTNFMSVTVNDGIVRLWGAVESQDIKDAARVAAENVPGVREVKDMVSVLPTSVRNVLWGE